MREYRFLHIVQGLTMLGGILGIALGIIVILLAVPNLDSRGGGWGEMISGVSIVASSGFAIGFAELVDLLFEIRSRLAGTYVMPNPKSVKIPNPPAPVSK